MGIEKRRAERLSSLFFVEIQSDATKESMGAGVVTNMSKGGFQLETESLLKKGNKYHCQFEVPFTFAAEVMWDKASGNIKSYGLKFCSIPLLEKFVLKKILKGPRRNRHI